LGVIRYLPVFPTGARKTTSNLTACSSALFNLTMEELFLMFDFYQYNLYMSITFYKKIQRGR